MRPLAFFSNGCVCCVEHPNTACVELKNQALFGIYPNAVAGKFPAVIDKLHSVIKLDA